MMSIAKIQILPRLFLYHILVVGLLLSFPLFFPFYPCLLFLFSSARLATSFLPQQHHHSHCISSSWHCAGLTMSSRGWFHSARSANLHRIDSSRSVYDFFSGVHIHPIFWHLCLSLISLFLFLFCFASFPSLYLDGLFLVCMFCLICSSLLLFFSLLCFFDVIFFADIHQVLRNNSDLKPSALLHILSEKEAVFHLSSQYSLPRCHIIQSLALAHRFIPLIWHAIINLCSLSWNSLYLWPSLSPAHSTVQELPHWH